MIAPIRSPKEILEREVSPRSRARRLAAAFLRDDFEIIAPPVKAWKAWLIVAWMAGASTFYAYCMLAG